MAKKRQSSLVTTVTRILKTGNCLVPQDPEPLGILRQAEDFAWTAGLIHEKKEKREWDYFRNPSLGFAASVVSSALSIELYLKCLLCIESKHMKTHDLLKLFERLRPSTRKRIAALFKEDYQRDENLRMYVGLFLNAERTPSNFVKPTVRNILKQSSTAFTDWRYSYEEGRKPFYVANHLMSAIRTVVLEKHPEWEDYVSNDVVNIIGSTSDKQ